MRTGRRLGLRAPPPFPSGPHAVGWHSTRPRAGAGRHRAGRRSGALHSGQAGRGPGGRAGGAAVRPQPIRLDPHPGGRRGAPPRPAHRRRHGCLGARARRPRRAAGGGGPHHLPGGRARRSRCSHQAPWRGSPSPRTGGRSCTRANRTATAACSWCRPPGSRSSRATCPPWPRWGGFVSCHGAPVWRSTGAARWRGRGGGGAGLASGVRAVGGGRPPEDTSPAAPRAAEQEWGEIDAT